MNLINLEGGKQKRVSTEEPKFKNEILRAIDIVRPEQFFEVGDIDDTASINRAIAYVHSLYNEEEIGIFEYGTVEFSKKKKYKISSEIILLKYVKLDLTTCSIDVTSNIDAVITTNVADLILKGRIKGDSAVIKCNNKASWGIKIKWYSEFFIDGIYVESAKVGYYKFGDNATASSSYGLIGSALQGDRQRPQATIVGSHGILFENATDNKIFTSYMISSETGYYSVETTASNTFISCHAWARLPESNQKFGFVLGNGSKAIDCYADTQDEVGFYLKNGRVQLTNCSVYNNYKGGNNLVGVRIAQNAKYCTVLQTRFIGTGSKSDPNRKWIKKDVEFEASYDPAFDGHIVKFSSFDKVETRTVLESNISESILPIVTISTERNLMEVSSDNQVVVGKRFKTIASNPNSYINTSIFDILCERGIASKNFFLIDDITQNPTLGGFWLDLDDVVFQSKIGIEVLRIKRDGSLQINQKSYIISGMNNPEGFVSGNRGSIYLRTNGGINNSLFVKTTDTGTSGWVSVVQVSQNKVVALQDGLSLNIEAVGGTKYIYRCTISGGRTIKNPQNPSDGQEIIIEITQDNLGNRTPIWESKYDFSYVLSDINLNPSKTTMYTFRYNAEKEKWFCINKLTEL